MQEHEPPTRELHGSVAAHPLQERVLPAGAAAFRSACESRLTLACAIKRMQVFSWGSWALVGSVCAGPKRRGVSCAGHWSAGAGEVLGAALPG